MNVKMILQKHAEQSAGQEALVSKLLLEAGRFNRFRVQQLNSKRIMFNSKRIMENLYMCSQYTGKQGYSLCMHLR